MVAGLFAKAGYFMGENLWPPQEGNPKAIRFPRSRLKNEPLGFSFSGLKTAVLYHMKGPGGTRTMQDRADLADSYEDIAASFEAAVVDVLVKRSLEAAAQEGVTDLVIGGGVAANRVLRAEMSERAPEGLRIRIPSIALCADNAAMIALRGLELLEAGVRHDLDLEVVATGE